MTVECFCKENFTFYIQIESNTNKYSLVGRAGTVEYTDCIFAEVKKKPTPTPNEYP